MSFKHLLTLQSLRVAAFATNCRFEIWNSVALAMRAKFPFQILAVTALAAVLVSAWTHQLSGSSITKDAHENLRLAYNLANYGVLSLDIKGERPSTSLSSQLYGALRIAGLESETGAPPSPSNYREPLPPILLAAYLKSIGLLFEKELTLDYLGEGSGAQLAKLSNVFWAGLLCIATFVSVNALTGSFLYAAAGTFLIGLQIDIDTMYTEVPGAALLVFASYFLMMALRTQRTLHYILAGSVLGTLTLTKAVFLYVAAGLIGFLVVWNLWRRRRKQIGSTGLVKLLVLALSFCVVVGPWLTRNAHYLGTAQITPRGGLQLMVRAKKDQMNWTEYRGSFYVWAPPRMRHAVGSILDFGPDDLKRGGRLQRLNRSDDSDFAVEDEIAEHAGRPEAVISFYRAAQAERNKLVLEFVKQGHPQPGIAADTEIKRRAIRIMLSDSLKHIAVTVPVLWRGAFWLLPSFALFLCVAFMLRRFDLVAFALPSIGLILFQALTIHCNPRHNMCADPTALIGLIFVGYWLQRSLVRRCRVAHALQVAS